MHLAPSDTALGNLTVEDVFDYVDFPRLFTALTPTGNRYVVFCVEENADSLVWLYLPVSPSRNRALRESQVSLRTALLEPEDGLLQVTTYPRSTTVVTRLASAPEEWLPFAGEYLIPESSPSTIDTMDSASGPLKLASRTWRLSAELAIDLPGQHGHSAPARVMGEILVAFQQLVDALAGVAANWRHMRGALPPEILTSSQLEFRQVFTGSLGLRFLGPGRADLFGRSSLDDPLGWFSALLRAGSEREALVQMCRELGPRATTRYRIFLEQVDKSKASLRFRWSGPKIDRSGGGMLGRDVILDVLEALTEFESQEAERVVVVGELIALNLRTRTFELVDNLERRKYAGKFVPEALPDGRGAEVGHRYRAELRAVLEVNSATGEEKTRYILVQLLAD
jgi:hypothetical protein